MLFKEPSSGLGGLDAHISYCEQIRYHFGLFIAIYSTVLISLTPS
jgi:hypothetical protein